ncbi:extensin family protein [Frateuria sp. STR12]|uniref:extensin-like domain-containing protein n=1 Tax=Frateuria hangzhouensis TaxID=2995589 RepID=UPI002260BF9C|nr:extensin family protein [Frateuria sp. STR12]MCX7512842.1 extensin family protein [Frateuria sp. STR12]
MRAFLLFLLLLALLTLVWSRGWRPPDRYNPWAPLDLREPPDLFFRYKLDRLAREPAACRAALARAGARFEPLRDRAGPGACGWTHAVRLEGTGEARLQRPAIVTCPLAATLVLLDRQVLQPAASVIYRSHVTRIDHVGSYACRNVYGRPGAPLSRHARAAAIDLTGFALADGHTLRIADDWKARGKASAFLHRVHNRACEVAGMVLGPDYNAEHHSHFHMQASGWGYCR